MLNDNIKDINIYFQIYGFKVTWFSIFIVHKYKIIYLCICDE